MCGLYKGAVGGFHVRGSYALEAWEMLEGKHCVEALLGVRS